MKTLVYNITVSPEDKEVLKKLQDGYSMDFRKLYNNLDLQKDPIYLSELNIKSSKFREYLIKEVEVFKQKYETNQSKLVEKINKLEIGIIDKKTFNKLTFLKRSLKSNICFGGRTNLEKRRKNLITNKQWRELRRYPMCFYGETASKGNRFFDLKNISKGEITFKLNKNTHVPIKISNKKHRKDLIKLEELSNNKQIPITIRLSNDKLWISFDECILNNTYFDYKKHQKDKPKGLSQEENRKYWRSKHQEHEEFLKIGKLDRYISIDVNPNEIGFSISDDKMNILDKGCYRIEGKVSENKRKFEYSQIIKELFNKIKHYKVSYFVIEDLDNLNKDNYGNKVSNRKNKLEFKKNYIFSIIERRCNETGTVLKKVKPHYSSFVGNLLYKEYDPIASSLELLRRGIGQYKLGFRLVPEYDPNNIITDQIDGYVDLDQFKSFQELFKSIRNKSYRRKTKTFSSQKFTKCDKSHVYLCF